MYPISLFKQAISSEETNKQTNQPLCLRNQSTLKRNACGSSKINSCFYCSLNRWYKVIYNHPIGRKNTTNIYHLYRPKSPVFFHPPLAPEVFFFQRHVFHQTPWGSPCLMASCWIVCWRWVFNGTVPNHQRILRMGDIWEHFFHTKRVVNGPNEITPQKKVGKTWECQKIHEV